MNTVNPERYSAFKKISKKSNFFAEKNAKTEVVKHQFQHAVQPIIKRILTDLYYREVQKNEISYVKRSSHHLPEKSVVQEFPKELYDFE